MKSLASVLICLLLIGCARNRWDYITPLHSDAGGLVGREDILEVVFRHICQPEPVEKEVSHNVNLVHKVYFLALGNGRDPSPGLLKRLADLKAPVKPMSAGVWREMFIFDKATGERGAAFAVRGVWMGSQDDC